MTRDDEARALVALYDDDYQPMFGSPITGWFRWFAWHPTRTVDRGWRWLRPLWRRRIAKHAHLDGGADFWFQDAVRTEREDPR